MSRLSSVRLLLSLAWIAATGSAQQFPFQMIAVQGTNAITLANGGQISFNTPAGQSQSAQVTATFNGVGQITISNQPGVIGSTEFKASFNNASLPATLNPGDSIVFTIQFAPANATAANAQLTLPFTLAIPGSAPGTNAISLFLSGSAPAFVLSYALQSNQNMVALQPGGTIPFPQTAVNSTSQATLSVMNTGSGPGAVNGVSITGAAFHLMGLPLFPYSVAAGQSLQVQVVYQPSGAGSDTGQVSVNLGSGSPITINLQGGGNAPRLTYQITQPSPATSIVPGGTISIPTVQVGQSSSMVVQVTNTGNAPSTITNISNTGQAFQLSGVPQLPQTLAPGANLSFTLTFTPAAPGPSNGTLTVNTDLFNVTGSGNGSLLQYSYTANGNTVTINNGNTSVVFSPVMVTQSAQLTFDVKNAGTTPAVLANIGVNQANSPFTVSNVPPLPAQVPAGGDLRFTIKFAPATVGFSNATLQVDSVAIPLVGSGTQPPALPSYSISGPTGNATPQSQPMITLTLAGPYAIDLTGVLTMKVVGSLPVDPAAQFATGGRTVNFTIPANTTSAVFDAVGTQLGLQTGTVASTITLTPTFATKDGNVDLTPGTPQSLQFAIAASAPTLVANQIVNPGTTGFTVQITGFSPTRKLTTAMVQFNTQPGYTMSASQYTVDVSGASAAWFNTTASQTYGGQFRMQIPFNFQGAVPANQSILQSIASVSVSLANDTGTSNAVLAHVN